NYIAVALLETNPTSAASKDVSKPIASRISDDEVGSSFEQVRSDKGSAPSSTQGSTSKRNVPLNQPTSISCEETNDEELMLRHLPWTKVIITLLNSMNLNCNHEHYCHPRCFERVYRQCCRLTEALRKVYGEDLSMEGRIDKRKVIIDAWNSWQEDKRRAKSAAVRQAATLDKTSMALRSLLMEKLAEIEENKEWRSKVHQVSEILQ
ncbi:unnamed protein product, partial [Dracunculus medinensis]|uniref:UNC80 domain-containing protein n=1 Tax=Dracunculus medinensis TaxID=318479 RepID=A0A0N4UG79_DRAME